MEINLSVLKIDTLIHEYQRKQNGKYCCFINDKNVLEQFLTYFNLAWKHFQKHNQRVIQPKFDEKRVLSIYEIKQMMVS